MQPQPQATVDHRDSSTSLQVTSDGDLIDPVRGQQAPMRGWRSLVDREVVPAWSFGFRAAVDGPTAITTSFDFAPDAVAEERGLTDADRQRYHVA